MVHGTPASIVDDSRSRAQWSACMLFVLALSTRHLITISTGQAFNIRGKI
jgi:hypothetical protein